MFRTYLLGMPKTRYGQFCPVAKAAEIVAERWTPLVIRELLLGSTRFNEIRRGVPLMSPSLLSRRLRELEEAGIVVRDSDGSAVRWELTPAGRELMPVIESLGNWGKRWTTQNYDEKDLDPAILMLDMRRNINAGAVPPGRTTIHFHFSDMPEKLSRFWLIVEGAEADVCLDDPGHEPELFVEARLRDFVASWMGDVPFDRAIRQRLIRLEGPPELCRTFHSWFRGSIFAPVRRGSIAS